MSASFTPPPPPTHTHACSGGVYSEPRCALKPKKLDHAVVLVGWGTRKNEDYWIVRNSWGPAWGSSGVVRILKGVDYLGIENDVWAACPEGAAHCALTAAVDTSVMDVSLSVADRAAAGLGVGRSRSGGKGKRTSRGAGSRTRKMGNGAL